MKKCSFVMFLVIAASIISAAPALYGQVRPGEQATTSGAVSALVSGNIAAKAGKQAQALSRIISVDLQNVTLENALAQIAHSSGLRISYSSTHVPISKSVSLALKDVTLAQALTEALRGTEVDYALSESGMLVIAPKEAAALASGVIAGKVTAEDGSPIVGANVVIAGTYLGAATNINGQYTIRNVPPGSYTLTASAVGFRKQSAAVSVAEGETATQDFVLPGDILLMGEIVTTATRTGRQQKEATVSMMVISDNMIRSLQPSSAADVLARVPGISAEGGGGEVASNIFVRGVPAGGQYRYQTLQVDGMPLRSIGDDGGMSAQDVYFRQDLNIQSLEVVKGGSSSLFGFSAPGGIINYITKTGGSQLSTTVRATAADKNLFRYDFNTNGPLGENYRFNLGGFYRYDEGPRVSGLPTQGFQIRGNVTRLLEDGYLRLHLTLINDRVQFFLPIAYTSKTREIAIPVDGTMNSAEAADLSLLTPDGNFQSRMANGVLTNGSTTMLEYYNDLGDGWSLHNKTKWMDVDHEFNIFIPGLANYADAYARTFFVSPTDKYEYSYTNHPGVPFTSNAVIPQGTWTRLRPTSDFANQLVLQKTIKSGDTEHRLTAGAYLSRTEYGDRIIFTNTLFELASNPRLLTLVIKDATGAVRKRVTRNGVLEVANNYRNARLLANNAALFAGDEMKFGDLLRLDVGLRYERQTGTIQVEGIRSYDLRTPADSSEAIKNVRWGSGSFVRRTVQFSDWAASVGINYALDASTNLFAVGSKSYVFPGLTTFAGNVTVDSQGKFRQPEPDKNETFLQVEGGLKYAGSELGASASVFLTRIQDRLQANLKIIDGQNVIVTEAVGKSRSYGVELTGAYAPRQIPGSQLQISFTYQDPRYSDFKVYSTAGTFVDLKDKKVLRQANVMANAALTYDRSGFDALVSFSYTGDRFGDDANLFTLDAFSVVTAGAGYTFSFPGGQTLRAGLHVYNLFDSQGLTEGDPRLATGVDPTQFPFLNARPILPRRVSVSLTYNL